jgi:hypothetical protein
VARRRHPAVRTCGDCALYGAKLGRVAKLARIGFAVASKRVSRRRPRIASMVLSIETEL